MLPCNSSGHAAYQDFVLSEIFTHYPDPFSLSKDTWKTIIEFWHLDLSLTDTLMLNRYSKRGPAPRLPSPLIQMVFPPADWAYACIAMDMSPRKTAVNTGAQKQTVRRAVSVKRPAHPPNMARPYTQLKDNPSMFNIPPRDSKEWDKEYDRRTSVERSNKREKQDYKLEDGRHRSTKMWYCRLYDIMMLQHLDAWEMPSVKDFQNAIQAT